jgi:hypothetical protein
MFWCFQSWCSVPPKWEGHREYVFLVSSFWSFFFVRVLFLSTSLFLLFGFFDFAVFLHVSLLL